MVQIEWTERSLEDLNEIYDYIARDSKSYATLFIKKIYESIQKLKDFPKIGRIVPEINISTVREIIFQNYRIIYRIMVDYVEVITVIHGSRLL
ncbi:MAG: type II toxin-antitoxin system RelE/ParE family toxin, partial [Candidatus Lokiarchaeota archaeon]|nr:type II toxin-antitoxin system RelE/ParE family toxin [Candidatus Lokiarchaeota archaeon]